MPTLVQFAERDPIVVEEDFQTVNEAFRGGSALVHWQGSEARIAVFASNIAYIEERTGEGPWVSA